MNDTLSTNPTRIIFAVIFSLIILLLISGCDLMQTPSPPPPTATATQTGTPTPTIDWFPATPTPTPALIASPTPAPTLENLREGITEILVADDFTNESLWVTGQSPSGNIAYGNQNLTLAIARQDTSLTSVSQHALPTGFYFEISVETALCQPQDQVGIIFLRQSENDFYRLLITCGGQSRLELVQSGQTIVVHDWESAAQIQLGTPATNRLGIWVNRGVFQLFINDTFQFEERIARDRDGGLAIYARTITGSAMTVKFSNLQIYRVVAD